MLQSAMIAKTRRKRYRRFTIQVQDAINNAPMSRYRMARTLGIGENTLSRFMCGHGGLSMDTLDKILKLLDLELQPRGE